MFIGHYAVALGAKKAAPRVSFGTLFLAAQFLDLLWPILLLAGVEHVRVAPGNTAFTPLDFYDYPISHSLATVIVWSSAFGIAYWLLRKDRRSAVVVGVCVLSHWVLDFLSHRPDVPLAPGMDRYVGLGLWNSVPATVAIELVMFIVGVLLFLSVSTPKDRTGRFAFWSLVILLLLMYAGNIVGGPPPNVGALAWFGMTQWLVVPWAYWIDRHLVTRSMRMQREEGEVFAK
jgi:hypothetical protein